MCVAAKLTTLAAYFPIAHPCDFLGNAPLLTVMVEIALYAFYGLALWLGRASLVYWTCAFSIGIGCVLGALNLPLSEPLQLVGK